MSDYDDDIDPGPIVSGEVAPAPSEPRPTVPEIADERSRDQIVKDQFNIGLTLAARGTESAEDYFKERETQGCFLEGEDLSPGAMREWHERTHTALQRAVDQQARARGEVPPSQQSMSEENIPGYVAPDAADYDKAFAAAKERFSDYFDRPEKLGQKEVITEWLTTHDPKGVLTGHFMASPLGPQMAEALAGEPGVIQYLANLPPQIRAGEMKKLEGYVAAQEQFKQQSAAYQEPQSRRVSAAPPPISPPRGGANVPKDLRSLATKDSVDEYIKARREQEKRAFQEEQLQGWRR